MTDKHEIDPEATRLANMVRMRAEDREDHVAHDIEALGRRLAEAERERKSLHALKVRVGVALGALDDERPFDEIARDLRSAGAQTESALAAAREALKWMVGAYLAASHEEGFPIGYGFVFDAKAHVYRWGRHEIPVDFLDRANALTDAPKEAGA